MKIHFHFQAGDPELQPRLAPLGYFTNQVQINFNYHLLANVGGYTTYNGSQIMKI